MLQSSIPLRYFLQLSFKGTAYHGWQRQRNAMSVQQILDETLSKLLKENILTSGAGRTDTGVHARVFYAHFDTKHEALHKTEIVYRLNSMLPFDIAIQRIFPVKDDAHARFDATSRTYEYVISRTKDPFLKDYTCYLYGELDLEKMNEAAQLLLGTKDFGCFSKSRTQVKTNICTVISAEWIAKDHRLIFTITADRFLRNMVRAIVGTHIELGQDKITLDDYIAVIKGRNRSDAGYSVPAEGLSLMDIQYKERIRGH